jgi:SulP family sulfate permease
MPQTREAIPTIVDGVPIQEQTTQWAQLAMALAFIVGMIQIGLGLLRLGFVVNFISEAVIVGFTTGAAFLIAATQVSVSCWCSVNSNCSAAVLLQIFQVSTRLYDAALVLIGVLKLVFGTL